MNISTNKPSNFVRPR